MNNMTYMNNFGGMGDSDMSLDPYGMAPGFFVNEMPNISTMPDGNSGCAAANPPSVGCPASVVPETLTNPAFLPAYLRKHIGKMVKLEFLIGNCLETKIGQLLEVGTSFIVLKLYQPCTTMVCDIASIKFATIAHGNEVKSLI